MSLNVVIGTLILGAAPQGLSLGILIVGVVVLAIGLYLSWTAVQDSKAYNNSRQVLDDELASIKAKAKTKSKPKTATPKKKPEATSSKKQQSPTQAKELAGAKKDLAQSQTDLKKSRKSNKQLRDKNHSMSSELQTLRTKDKKSRDKKVDAVKNNTQTALTELRMELVEAKQDVESWKARSSDLKEQLAKKPKTVIKEVIKAAEMPAEIDLSDLMDSDEVKAKIRSVEKQHRNKLKQAKQDLVKIEKDLRGKLKRTSLNLERQRRRADNNDRAYMITQRELDATRERIKYLEEQLHKANFAVSTAANQLVAQATEGKKAEKKVDENAETELDVSLRAALSDASTLQEVSAIDDAWSDFDL